MHRLYHRTAREQQQETAPRRPALVVHWSGNLKLPSFLRGTGEFPHVDLRWIVETEYRTSNNLCIALDRALRREVDCCEIPQRFFSKRGRAKPTQNERPLWRSASALG
jgi:hypothetical protein